MTIQTTTVTINGNTYYRTVGDYKIQRNGVLYTEALDSTQKTYTESNVALPPKTEKDLDYTLDAIIAQS